MNLPNATIALVERQKITEYLLNREHPDNGGKADFFIALGFSVNEWETLAEALGSMALSAQVTQSIESVTAKSTLWMAKLRLQSARHVSCEPFG
jgi:predicted nucleic acid-binding Zn ribbon protein